MAFRITPTTELQAVNTLLSIIGEAPVSSITGNTGVDVSIALQILDETNVEVQSRGWHFNTEAEVKLALDQNSKIPVGSNVIQIDTSKDYRTEYDITFRNGFLYDLKNKTDVFTSDPQVDKVLVQQFEHIPEYARRYIVVKASRRFAARYIGASELVKLANLDEQEAHVAFEAADSRAMDANILKDEYNMNYITNRGNKRSSRS